MGPPHPAGTGRCSWRGHRSGVQGRHWQPVDSPKPPSAARRPSGAKACLSESLHPGGLHCGSWAGVGSPCSGHHTPFQLTSAQASPFLLPQQVGEGRNFNRLLWAGLALPLTLHIAEQVSWPIANPLEHKQVPELDWCWASGQDDKDPHMTSRAHRQEWDTP